MLLKKKDIEKIGKDLLKEVHEMLNNDYFKETFPEEINKKSEIFYSYLIERVFGNCTNIIKSDTYNETTPEEELEFVIKMIKNGRFDIKVIYETLRLIDLDVEIEENLYFKNNSFLNLYSVFYNDYIYLED